MVKMLRLSMKAMKLLAMKQSTTKRPSSATNLQEEQRDGAMKEASTYLVRAHQRQLPRSRLNDTPDLITLRANLQKKNLQRSMCRFESCRFA